MSINLTCIFDDIASTENLLDAWSEFIKGKRGKADVQEFSMRLMDNIFLLHRELASRTYKHGPYQPFNICDPKPRNIHKALVRDRLLHHALYRKLYPFFNRTFIADSYSCRTNKGTHKALDRFSVFARKVSRNHTKTAWVLKCDIRKFFANIDHLILLDVLGYSIPNRDIMRLLREVIASFCSTRLGIGLPLGNLTSQLFVNIYMNEFDRFVKHALKAHYYIRYADDFAILSDNRAWLEGARASIREFLRKRLRLELHPEKVFIKTAASGVDFLGWIHFPNHRVLRTSTKRRMLKRIATHPAPETVGSYLELLRHGNGVKIKQQIAALLL